MGLKLFAASIACLRIGRESQPVMTTLKGRFIHPDDLVELHEIDVVCPEPVERFFELT